jgi:hypothetical protein
MARLPMASAAGVALRLRGDLAEVARLPCVWTYRDRSLEKDWCFPFKLPKSGPDKSKRIVAVGRVCHLKTALIMFCREKHE